MESRNDDLFQLATNLTRTAGEAALADASHAAMIREAREQGMKEGRQALVDALLSELDAAKPNYRCIEVALRNEETWREPGLTGGEARTADIAVNCFADHLRQWLESGAPERQLGGMDPLKRKAAKS